MGNAQTKKDDNDSFLDELKPGTELLQGQYKIVEFLNSGGFGITYLATDSLDRKVVIKECFPSSFCQRSRSIVQARSRAHSKELASVVNLFVQEARSLSKLDHPNIVGVHQVFEDNQTAYMVLDFVEGRDLLDTLEDKDHGLTPPQIKGILKDVLGAVQFIHDQDILHRDISPDNILLDADLRPVLIDFGAAREEATKQSRVLSALRVVKDGYSPQEFYVQGSAQTPSSDLYALGASFYHLIAGDTPVNSQSRLAAIAAEEADPYVPLVERAEGYDRGFLQSIDKALGILPKDRIQSANEWLEMIDGKRRSSKVVTMAAPKSSAAVEAEQAAKKSPMVLLLGSAAAVAIIAVVGFVAMGSSDDASAPVDVAEVETPAAPAVSAEETAQAAAAQAEADAEAEALRVAEAEAEIAAAEAEAEQLTEIAAAEAEVARQAGIEAEAERLAELAVAEAKAARQAEIEAAEAEAAQLAENAASEAEADAALQTELAAVEAEAARLAEVAAEEAAAEAEELRLAETAAAEEMGKRLAEIEAADAEASEIAKLGARIPQPRSDAAAQDYTDAQQSPLVLANVPSEPLSPQVQNVFSRAPSPIGEGTAETPLGAARIAVPAPGALPEIDADAPQKAEPTLETFVSVPDLGSSNVLTAWSVDLPFEGSATSNEITEVDFVSPAWAQVGSKVIAVNGTPVNTIADINAVLRNTIEPGDSAAQLLTFTVEPADGGVVGDFEWEMPIIQDTILLNGMEFVTRFDGESWKTSVTKVPDANGDLREGDVLVALMSTSEMLDQRTSLGDLLARELEGGANEFSFAVSREGAMWIASMTYLGGA
jgi:non-specific serine/threonine protein kinase